MSAQKRSLIICLLIVCHLSGTRIFADEREDSAVESLHWDFQYGFLLPTGDVDRIEGLASFSSISAADLYSNSGAISIGGGHTGEREFINFIMLELNGWKLQDDFGDIIQDPDLGEISATTIAIGSEYGWYYLNRQQFAPFVAASIQGLMVSWSDENDETLDREYGMGIVLGTGVDLLKNKSIFMRLQSRYHFTPFVSTPNHFALQFRLVKRIFW